jgi:hypothetical protein
MIFSMNVTVPPVIAAINDAVCRHCGNDRCGPGPTLCVECGRCYGEGNCQDSPICVTRDPVIAYGGAEDVDRLAALTVVSTSPADAASGVAINATISILFSHPIVSTDLMSSKIYLVDSNDVEIGPVQNSWPTGAVESGNYRVTFHLASDLTNATVYRFHISSLIRNVYRTILTAYSVAGQTGFQTVA